MSSPAPSQPDRFAVTSYSVGVIELFSRILSDSRVVSFLENFTVSPPASSTECGERGSGREPDLAQKDVVSTAVLRDLAAEIFEVDPDEIIEGAAFYEDLGIDSVQKVEFVVRIERQLGVRLTDEEAAGLQDFGDTLAVLRDRGISIGP